MMRSIPIAAFLLAIADRAAACAVCFGDPGSDQTKALMVAMSFLLAVVASVLATIVVVAIRIARRAAVTPEPELPETNGLENT
jgi:hypothetical protein